MKKITLLCISLLIYHLGNSQNTCASAGTAVTGLNSVAAVDGSEVPAIICAVNGTGATSGEWYTYTATTDGTVTITTDLPQNDGDTNSDDTRVHIYIGGCESLTCYAANDDISSSNYLSEVTFPVISGETYYIAWDDRWSALGFDFELTQNSYSCNFGNSLPYTLDLTTDTEFSNCFYKLDDNADALGWTYNSANDLDGDGTDDPFLNIFPPDVNYVKDDWLISPAITGVANTEYTFTIVYNAVDFNGTANETLEAVALSDVSPNNPISTLGNITGVTQSGELGDSSGNDLITQAYTSTLTYTPDTDGDFYLGLHATTGSADSDILIVLEITLESAILGVEDIAQTSFSYSYNKHTQSVILESSSEAFENIEFYNLFGQKVLNQPLDQVSETVEISSLSEGLYLAKIQMNSKTQTVRILKY